MDGFESGDFSAWTETDAQFGSLNVQRTIKHHGNYAFKSSLNVPSGQSGWAVAIKKGLNSGGVYLYARAYIKVDMLPTAGNVLYLFSVFADVSEHWLYPLARAGIQNDAGTMKWHLTYYNNGVYSDSVAATISTNTWYSIEVGVYKHGSAGWVKLWVDGTLKISKENLNTAPTFTTWRVEAGLDITPSTSFSVNEYVDCVVVADIYIGPEALPTQPTIYKFSINSTQHNNYGLAYPVTYVFDVPSGYSSLKAYHRHSPSESWSQLVEKASNDFFNGIEYVRFNYTNNKAYVGVAFSDTSDDIYIKITDQNGNTLPIAFDTITRYYDDRQAVVVVTTDDWDGETTRHNAFMAACDAFQSRNVWLTVGIVTVGMGGNYPPNYNDIQGQLNEGFIEVASHSRTHPHVPYSDYDSEIGGSKSDIIGNLTLPPFQTKGNSEYVWAWIEPYGESDLTVRQKLGQHKYLIARTAVYGPAGDVDYKAWDHSNGLFEETSTRAFADSFTLQELNDAFNGCYANGQIYYFWFHPVSFDWSGSNKITQHLDYIKNKTDVWYVGFGALYVYRLVASIYSIEVLEEPETLLTIGEFQAPRMVYANQYFFLNATVQNTKGATNFVNATIEISNGIILKWDSTTDTFNKLQDTYGYCTLDSSNSFRTTINSTAYKLSWKIKLGWTYPESSVSIIATNTKVFDRQGASESGSYDGLFTFEDDLIVYSASVDDSRVNPLQPITFTGTIYYQGTTIPPEDTSGITVRINLGNVEKASTTVISPSGTFTAYCASESAVGSYAYTIFAVTDENSVENQTISIIVDRIKVSGYTISDNRANVGDNVNIDVTLVYEYDNRAVTTGTITVNGYAATHIGSGVYRITRALSTVGSETYNTVAGSESTYALSTVNQNGQSTTIIWDMVVIDTFSVSDSRVNIGSVASFTVAGKYAYDNIVWSGTYALNDTASKSAVGKYGYKIANITDSNYALTVFRQTAPDAYVIFDRINVVTYGSDDGRLDVNTEATFYLTLEYEYDGSPVVDGVAYLNGSLPLSWSYANSRWEYKTTKLSVQRLTVYLTSVGGNTYGITALNPNTSSKTISVIWDRIKIADGGATKETLTLGETATIWFKASYEYDETTFNSTNGTLYLNGKPMTWSPTNKRWEYTYTANTIGTITFTITAVLDTSQGLTTINDMVGGQTVTVWSMPFAIISNSTITELTFDSTTKIITFKVSGPEGTIGYTNVTIAKTLIQNISELTIYLDGNQINYTFTSTEYTWLIHFTYTHSTHKVTILLTTLY